MMYKSIQLLYNTVVEINLKNLNCITYCLQCAVRHTVLFMDDRSVDGLQVVCGTLNSLSVEFTLRIYITVCFLFL